MLFKEKSFITSRLILAFLFCSTDIHAASENNYLIKNNGIHDSLNGLIGNSSRGRALVRNKNKGNCLSCHRLPIPEDDLHGTIGPSLYAVALRLSEAQIRLRVTDMKQLNPYTIMPGFFRTAEKMTRISPLYENTTILTAQEIEDIIAYLITLKSSQKRP